MRNLKRALSLGLTAAMISGLMVMGSSAASYADVTSEDNVEAIEVLESVGIMIGDENGNFNPDQNVTRNEMAVVMANLMEYNVATYKDTSPFTDVPSWAEPYVAACWTNGITSGYSDTIYGGSDDVTTAQAALMLMKALGYFQYSSDFGSDWQLATTRQGNAIDLFNGVDSGVTQAMTRNDVAQLVLNTLRSGTVQAETNGSLTVGNVTIATDVKYNYVTSNQTYATAIDDARSTSNTTDANRSIVELGEQLYMGDLKLNDNSDDDFMRPARTWSYDGKEIGTYAKRELMVESYTTGVTGKDMYDLLSSATIRDNELFNYVDGEDGTIKASQLVRSNDDDLAGTGDGVLTEVYLDQDADEITIVSISTWLAKATADYNESKEYAPLTVYTGVGQTATYNVDVDEVASVADVAEDEFYQVNITYKDNTRGEVVAVSPVEVLADSTVTKYSASDKGDGAGWVTKLTTGGTEYERNEMAFYDEDVLDTYDDGLLTDSTYNVYLDQYGYFLGVDLYDGAKNYVFITGYDRPTSNLSVKTADAAGIFLDGTMEKIEVNVKDTNENIKDANKQSYDAKEYFKEWVSGGEYALNRWYTYTVDQNGVYTLKPAVRMTATDYNSEATVNTSNLRVNDNVLAANQRSSVYGEDASVYLTVDLDEVDTTLDQPNKTKRAITEVTGVYTGVQEVEIEIDPGTDIEEAEIYTVYDSDFYIVGAVVVGEARGNNANIAYLIDGAKSESYDGTYYYWEFECVMDGQVQTLTAKSKYVDTIRALRNDTDDIVELRFDGDNYVVDVKDVDDIYGDDHYDELASNHIDPKYDTADFDVYDVTEGNELTLQGRTLYVLANREDMGLALTSDAKAVVIQDENEKTDVKSEFSSVSAAISHLADADTSVSGMQYDGRIIAALDSRGAASWVLFISDTPLKTGSQAGGSTDSGNWYKANIQKYASGLTRISMNVTRPDYVVDTNDLDYAFDVYVDNVLYASVYDSTTGTGTVVDANSRSDSYVWTNATAMWYAPIDVDSVVDVRNFRFTNLSDQDYFVQWYSENGTLLAEGYNTSSGTKAVRYVTNDLTGSASYGVLNGGNAPGFTLNTSKYDVVSGETVGYRVVGALDASDKAASGSLSTSASRVNINETVYPVDDLKDYVKIYLDLNDVTEQPITYSVKVADSLSKVKGAIGTDAATTGHAQPLSDFGLAADGASMRVILSAVSGLDKNDAVDMKIAMVVGTQYMAYDVTVETTAGDYTFKNVVGGQTAAQTIYMPAGDVTIENVTVVPVINKLAVKSAVYNADNNTLTIKFNEGVEKSDNTALTTTEITGAQVKEVVHTAGSDTVVVRFDSTWTTTKPVTLSSGVAQNADYDALNPSSPAATSDTIAASVTFTLQADNSVNF